MRMKRKKVGLVLGGGGAKAFAHLGAIKVLQKHGIPIDLLVSSSSGSAVAVLIANEISPDTIKEEIIKILNKITSNPFAYFFKRNQIIDEGFKVMLKNKAKRLEECKIPVVTTGTNITTGRLCLFEKGDLLWTTKLACCHPVFQKPHVMNNQLISDGGLLNNVPADICRQRLGDENIVITCSLENCFGVKDMKIGKLDLILRLLYLPYLRQREKTIMENSDVVIRPFKEEELSFKTWKAAFRYKDIKKLEFYFREGEREAEFNIELIKKKVYKS